MANPRQRRKARSSSHKAVSHSRHAKKNLKKMPPIRGPKILQDAWDKTKTVRQNYVALGLIHDLNPAAAGGAEPMEELQIEESQIASTSQLEQAAPIRKGFGKIIRDEAGNVLRIEMAEEDEPQGEKQDDEEMREPEVAGAVLGRWVTDLGRTLERISSMVQQEGTTLGLSNGGGARHTSSGERAYLERLVSKYGEDVEGMARDRRLNVEQRTAGALRQGLRKAGLAGRS
ncbi:hypothetical protein C0991_009750 [Blastosporella zonata]|nr:hypothetical protein C0991_009750 [Blastosporella zonata]